MTRQSLLCQISWHQTNSPMYSPVRDTIPSHISGFSSDSLLFSRCSSVSVPFPRPSKLPDSTWEIRFPLRSKYLQLSRPTRGPQVIFSIKLLDRSILVKLVMSTSGKSERLFAFLINGPWAVCVPCGIMCVLCCFLSLFLLCVEPCCLWPLCGLPPLLFELPLACIPTCIAPSFISSLSNLPSEAASTTSFMFSRVWPTNQFCIPEVLNRLFWESDIFANWSVCALTWGARPYASWVRSQFWLRAELFKIMSIERANPGKKMSRCVGSLQTHVLGVKWRRHGKAKTKTRRGLAFTEDTNLQESAKRDTHPAIFVCSSSQGFRCSAVIKCRSAQCYHKGQTLLDEFVKRICLWGNNTNFWRDVIMESELGSFCCTAPKTLRKRTERKTKANKGEQKLWNNMTGWMTPVVVVYQGAFFKNLSGVAFLGNSTTRGGRFLSPGANVSCSFGTSSASASIWPSLVQVLKFMLFVRWIFLLLLNLFLRGAKGCWF